MKKLFILAIAISSSVLFVQCKKTETLMPQEEVVTSVKSLSSDILNGTNWEVLSLVSRPNGLNLSWETRQPKLYFNDGKLEMKLGRDLCAKEYLNTDNKLMVTTLNAFTAGNPTHTELYNHLDGEFEVIFSTTDPNIMYLKNQNDTVLMLRKINSLTTNGVSSTMSIN